ncbi:hypothetical protein LJ656_08415 [Paraburkholderia sp. MMS20-SJTR3]|uniref:Uncharacterized protein n=1 Tax=Paraburkholderia sejongensis TaxID=2886946 RepID=A0ABS8JRS2_9BURK|nr:hypothetical protein [Paraburkholderia sp. MMS20-SJTR3]MCC8392609.1 hypothetical protein [Paraburkholderia sp. MMS20-SJTR3]
MRIVKLPGLIGETATPGVSAAIWALVLALLCFVSINHETVLPERFLLDGLFILERMSADVRFEAFGDSFDNLAWLFRTLGLGTLAISLLGFFASTFGLLLAIWRSGVPSLSYLEFMLACFWLFDQTVYIALPSKEIVISLAIFLIVLCKDSRFIVVIFTACALLVAVYLRSYWAITLAPTMLLYFGPSFLRKPPFLIVLAVVLFVCMAIDFRIQYGQPLDFARQTVNEFRDPSEVGSLIVQIIPGGNLLSDVSNAMLILGTFLLPVPLILSGVATQTLGGICTFFSLGATFSRYLKRAAVAQPARFDRLCFCFAVSFIATQAIFEPDYGSFLRHLSPISPLLMYLLLSSRAARESDAPQLTQSVQERLHFNPKERRWLKSSNG